MTKRKRPKRRRTAANEDLIGRLSAAIEYHQNGNLSQAEQAYQEILRRDEEQAVVHHLLSRLYWQTNRREEAVASLERALMLQEDYAEALLDLANMLSELEQLGQAEACLQKLIVVCPQDAMAHNNLGVVLKDQKRFDAAIGAYQRSLELDPLNPDTLCNLAHVNTLVSNLDEAVRLYRQAIECDPAIVIAHSCLASLLRRMERHDEARDVFIAWQKLEPNNPVPQHLLSTFNATEVPERASNGYVKQVFDQFAATFEIELDRLEYCGPQLIEAGLTREFAAETVLGCVLDAGCGTGLCGPALRGFADRLMGVDLSLQMLAIAEKRGLYDELIDAELCTYLRKQTARFDLIVAADTLGYFGDLNPLFVAAQQALRPAGRLLVTVELGDVAESPGYQLHPTGRYSHNYNYAIKCCTAAGLTIRDQSVACMRLEAEQEVKALVLTAIVGD